MTRWSFIPLFFLVFLALIAASPARVFADTASDLQDQITSLQRDIATYQSQLNSLGSQKSTLQSTINTLTISQKQLASQIKVTQGKISLTNLKIQELTNSIGDKESLIESDHAAIAKALRTIAQSEEVPLVSTLVSARSFSDAWQAADQTLQFNKALAKNIEELRAVQTTLSENRDAAADAKATLVSLNKDLANQNNAITAKRKAQLELLTQTKNQESTYQKLLAAAKAELASYSTFTQNAGGSGLLANQTSCDAWGCYYSQRDTLWGNMTLSGASSRLAAEGCLVTSMAMVLTHYGYSNVTPVTINSNPSNFSVFGGLLLFVTYFNGISASRVTAAIDANLTTGNPVIVGIRAYGGTHFVVLTSGSKGNYLMRDPYIANGKDISFTAHYPISSIYAIHKVVINK